MKTINERRFVWIAIPIEPLLKHLGLCGDGAYVAGVGGGPAVGIPKDARIVGVSLSQHNDMSPGRQLVRIVLESDNFPESCRYEGFEKYVEFFQ